MTNSQETEVGQTENPHKKGKCVSTLESWYRLIIVIAALGAFLFYLVLLPPPALSLLPGMAENLSTLAILFLWVVWVVYLSFFLIMAGFIFASPTLIQRKHHTQIVSNGELFRRVETLSKLLALKEQPEILLEKSNKALCMVFGTFLRPNKLLVSTGLLENIESSELDAVFLHELSHIKNRDVGIATWGDYLKSAIKYAILVIIALRIAVVAVDVAYGYMPNITNIFLELPLMITATLIVPFLAINSSLRERELLADSRALLCLKESTPLKSAMVKTVLINFKALSVPTTECKDQNDEPRKLDIASKVHAKFSQTKLASFLGVHPTIKQRIADLNAEKHILSSEKIKLPSYETMVLSGIASAYVLPVGVFLIALPMSLVYYLNNSPSTLLLAISLLGVLLFYVIPSVVIFLPIFESVRALDVETLGRLSRGRFLKHMLSVGKAVILASLTFFAFALLVLSGGEISAEVVIKWLSYALEYAIVAFTLSFVFIIFYRRKRVRYFPVISRF